MTETEQTDSVVIEVDSTVIKAFEYNYAIERLTVEFNSGTVWQYDGLPATIFEDMKTATSAGQYFNFFIRGKYQGSKLSLASKYD